MTDRKRDRDPPADPPDDKLIWCCDTLGFVDWATFIDHRWESSRAPDDDTLVDLDAEPLSI